MRLRSSRGTRRFSHNLEKNHNVLDFIIWPGRADPPDDILLVDRVLGARVLFLEVTGVSGTVLIAVYKH